MEIGHQLRALRIQKGLTQEELAERTDLSKGYISQLENDLSSPSMDTFFDILEVLGCPAADFFDEGPEEALTIYREEDMKMMELKKMRWQNLINLLELRKLKNKLKTSLLLQKSIKSVRNKGWLARHSHYILYS